jgi:D5 N terminal like
LTPSLIALACSFDFGLPFMPSANCRLVEALCLYPEKLTLRTDAGAARLFADLVGDEVRYDHARRRWLVWENHRWRPDADARS